MSTYQRITFRNEQDNNSDDASYQMFFDKIQGLSRTKIDEREFQGLSRPCTTTLNTPGFFKMRTNPVTSDTYSMKKIVV